MITMVLPKQCSSSVLGKNEQLVGRIIGNDAWQAFLCRELLLGRGVNVEASLQTPKFLVRSLVGPRKAQIWRHLELGER